MRKLKEKLDLLAIKSQLVFLEKKEAMDQIVIMFIIIAVAAGIIGLLYIYSTGTLLTTFQTKMNTLINSWFDHS